MKTLILFILFSVITARLFALPINLDKVKKVVQSHLNQQRKSETFSIKSIEVYEKNGLIYFYSVELSPIGFIIISGDNHLSPIIAYSFQDEIEPQGKLFDFLYQDISIRMKSLNNLPQELINKRRSLWAQMLSGTNKRDILMQSWPPAGTTSTGGWLETNWTQNAPYNQMCPMDPVSGSRSLVGCPATAMAQILNYHQSTNETQFNNGDRYYHNYSGRQFWIDDDYADNGFPSFEDLNLYLDTVNLHFQNNITLTNQDKAALSFACGVAAKQVFTSSGSGTFGVDQALEAYQRFNCNTVELLTDADTSIFTRLAQNMKDSLPAHLAIVNEAWTSGHNVVVDGYNTDNYFHVNFGWGGSYNAWYLIPDEMPYSLTVVEGLIVDIMKDEAVINPIIESANSLILFPNPANNLINIQSDIEVSFIEIYNVQGKIIQSFEMNNSKTLDVSFLPNGLYFVKIYGLNYLTEKLFIAK